MSDQVTPVGGVTPVTPVETLLAQIRDELRALNAHLAGDSSADAPAQRRTGGVRTPKPKGAIE